MSAWGVLPVGAVPSSLLIVTYMVLVYITSERRCDLHTTTPVKMLVCVCLMDC